MSSSDLQVQLDALSTIFDSDFGQLIVNMVLFGFIILLLIFHFSDFFNSVFQYNRNRRAANHCDDLHKGVKQGKCHYNDCTFRAGCPYYEKLTLRKRWRRFRAKAVNKDAS